MNPQNSRKRRVGTTAVKALIAAGAVAATVAGWALLPANDPPTAAAGQQTALGVPGTTDNGLTGGAPGVQAAPTAVPNTTAPGLVPPSTGFSRPPRAFTRSHSSR